MNISKEIKRLLLMNGASNIIFNYIGIFVNLYIWEKGKSIFDVAWFNMNMFIMWTICFVIGSKLMTRYSNRLLIRGVALGGTVTFLLLTFLRLDSQILWITVIALPVGAMWGFYCSAQNITLSTFGKGKDFEGYFSLSSIIGQSINVLNPIIFALVIQWIGYSGSFLLMFVFVTLLWIVSFRIPNITLAHEPAPLFDRFAFRQVFATGSLRWMVPSLLAAGVFLQFQALFTLLFTFSVSKEKIVIALLNVLYTCASIIAMLLYRRLRIHDNKWLWIGIVSVSAGFLIALFPSAPTLILSNILTTIGMFYFATIWNTRQFAIISAASTIEQTRIFIWRECLLNVTRILLLLLVLNVKEFHGAWFIGLLLAAMTCAMTIPYFSRMGTDTFAKEKAAAAEWKLSV